MIIPTSSINPHHSWHKLLPLIMKDFLRNPNVQVETILRHICVGIPHSFPRKAWKYFGTFLQVNLISSTHFLKFSLIYSLYLITRIWKMRSIIRSVQLSNWNRFLKSQVTHRWLSKGNSQEGNYILSISSSI